jgi:SAM-dependent methyltransferase
LPFRIAGTLCWARASIARDSLSMTDVVAAGAFWDREIIAPTHVSWMDDPRVRHSINELIGGGVPLPPGEWFMAHLGGRTFERGLSIGCGGGNLERVAIRFNLCKRIDAFDGSLQSLHVARTMAEKEGYAGRIRYFASDFNRPVLPRDTYDVVFFNQSLHHVGKLEKLYRAILLAMRPDALLYLDEYIGPSRSDWNDALIAPHRAVFAGLPPEVRKSDFVALPIQADDPSEAIRSSEIIEQLAPGFEIEMRGYGGNLLSVLYPLIDWTRAPSDLLPRLIEQDRAMAKSGSYYAVAIGRPARGLRKRYALTRWLIEPKAKRVLFELRRRLR